MSAGATLVLLPGLDGTDVFLRPLVAALPSTIRPVVVTYPASGAEEYRDVLEIVRRATGGLSTFYVLGVSSFDCVLWSDALDLGVTRRIPLWHRDQLTTRCAWRRRRRSDEYPRTALRVVRAPFWTSTFAQRSADAASLCTASPSPMTASFLGGTLTRFSERRRRRDARRWLAVTSPVG